MTDIQASLAPATQRPPQTDSIEDELAFWLRHLREVDAVLEKPALSLIALANHTISNGAKLPPWVSPTSPLTGDDAAKRESLLVHALCCSTLQRLWRTHRRYAWLPKDERGILENLQEPLARSAASVADPVLGKAASEQDVIGSLSDHVFGNLNPFVAAEVYWTLLHAGENRGVSGTGFLCLFTMWWALLGLQPPSNAPAGDTRSLAASVAAKCLRPMIELQTMFRTRAALYREIRTVRNALAKLAANPTPHNRWQFASKADLLSALLAEMSKVAINPKRFEQAAAVLSDAAKEIRPNGLSVPLETIDSELNLTITDLLENNERTFAESIRVLDRIRDVVIPAIMRGKEELRTRLRPERPDETKDAYWQRMEQSARQALAQCCRIMYVLGRAVACCRGTEGKNAEARSADATTIDEFLAAHQSAATADDEPVTDRPANADQWLSWMLARLADANERVAIRIEEAVAAPVNWCRFVVRQEVAYASAGNDTDFDAAELLSGVSIAERSGYISELEVEDALAKALRALRHDGSWTAGQPIYLTHRVLGVWPNTSDIAWLLTGAVTGKPKTRRADRALIAFVEWLERTRTHFERYLHTRNDDNSPTLLTGWSAETRESKTIDLWITAGAINALIEIREIIEYRLWELCEKRFFVFQPRKPLDEIDPVDLGAAHEARLHRRLRRAARASAGRGYRDAEYSFVFHGPPGSSKTAMAEALGRELWRETRPEARVVRITPADFTRRGEAGLDAEARAVFELLSHIRGVTIIFDEIDDLLRRRDVKGTPAFLKMVVPAMLNRLQDLRDAAPRQEICFIIAMNYIDNVEPALTRPGRIDGAVPVVYPDPWSRDNTLDRVIARNSATAAFSDRIRAHIVDETAGWPWPIYHRLCEAIAAEYDKRNAQATRQDIDLLISEFATQLQDTNSHYADPRRWLPTSPELVSEVAHYSFAFGRSREECAKAVRSIFPAADKAKWVLPVVNAIETKLNTEWLRAKRDPYARDTAMRAKDRMGATRIPEEKVMVFRIWAPTAAQVDLVRPNGTAHVLEEESVDVFSGQVEDMRTGDEYRYAVKFRDGEAIAVLDPYGREVDEEVHYTVIAEPPQSPPQHVRFTDWHQRLIYQVHPETCTRARTYEGMIERLDHIRGMRFDAIDLVGPGEAYDRGVCFAPVERRKAEHRWGGTEGLRAYVDAAHQRGLSVIVGVTSHDLLGRPGLDITSFTGYQHPDANLRATVVGPRPDFREKRVRELLITNALRWVEEIGVDGIRWTGTSYVRSDAKRQLAEGWDALRYVNEQLAARSPATFRVAQDLLSLDRLVTMREGCAGFHAQWSAGFERCVGRVLVDELESDFGAVKTAINTRYFGDAFHRIVYAESAESVRHANRRLVHAFGHAAPEDARRRAFLATALALVTPGIPMILQGQEIWDPVPLDGQTTLDWDAPRHRIDQRLFDLIALRKNVGANTRGLQGHRSNTTYNDRVLVVERWADHTDGLYRGSPGNHTIAVFNFNPVERKVPVTFPARGLWHVRFNSHAAMHYQDAFGVCDTGPEFRVDGERDTVAVGPYGVVLLSQDPVQ